MKWIKVFNKKICRHTEILISNELNSYAFVFQSVVCFCNTWIWLILNFSIFGGELPHLFLKIKKILLEKNKMHYQNSVVQIWQINEFIFVF